MTKKILLATNNTGKIVEFQAMLADLDIECIPQAQFGITDADEIGLSFVENAIIKARHACAHTQLPAIADDSGLEIDVLNGEPGIYSARYAGEHANFQANIAKLLGKLQDVPEKQRTARFQCVIVYMQHAHDAMPIICQGTWEGRILFEPRGAHGFGYDPIFYVPTHDCSAAELPSDIKNKISHRAIALQKLRALLL